MRFEVDQWLRNLVPALYPPTCVLCGAPGEAGGLDLCRGCRADLPLNHHACPVCALSLPAATPAGSTCGACQHKKPPYDACIVPYRYEGVMPYLLTGLKFHARMSHARLLGGLLSGFLSVRESTLPQALIPVPLHRKRLSERGFNQALEIARIPAHDLGIPLALDKCERWRATSAHSGLDARARKRDIRGAFRLRCEPEYRHLVLLDDVITTGSTVAELARVFKRAGVARVDVWALARTPNPG